MAIDCEDQELLDGFLAETTELLEKLDDDLISLEKSPEDADLMNRIFRSIHTVKGASSFLGFDMLVKVTHKTEDVLNRLRKVELTLTSEIMDVILEAVDLVKTLVADIKGGEIVERDLEGTIAKLIPFLSENAVEATVLAPVFAPKEEKKGAPAATPAEPAATAPAAEASAPPQEPEAQAKAEPAPSRQVAPAPQPKPQPVKEPQKAPAKGGGEDLADNSTVRVDVKRLDDLMNQVGELVLERNRMIQLHSDYQTGLNPAEFGDDFGKLSKRLNFVTSELQMQVLKMRMLPVEKVFKKFPRIVRNLARDLGKEVDLVIYGEETELDRSVVDEIGDPLIHLIRNALDHGLETPDQRLAAGKDRTGTVVLSAAHEGNQIVISIKDDGRGIDPDRIARKALDKGLVTDEQVAAMGTREILDLIFLPGFSTKEQTTDLSGRGVGMDVVRTNIRKLNGIIEIKNELGHGSEFILKLPLTLAIIQSLLVEVEKEVYSIPLASVIETMRVSKKEFHMIGGQEVLKLRDSVLPLLRLQRTFGCQEAYTDRDTCYVVIVGVAEKRIGLIVTRLLGQQEVAIKSLGKFLANLPGIGGSTIMGDGRVALIVDPIGLVGGAA
ncbi:chemotaxis protein CheA [Geomonas subterranea]|uniref:Chemotaxis protein CheA n=1 Tax=Geomonas subterranea TaxID=2847989 RepID=A0ABX8LDN3_9BACT|nr:chemotaxis protein CheA [Geomonas subterranea]QXE90153.1 chemotaxis protein CheA [Geomonas subterranea]QXM07721.1 chemotaxis protein CheA [Geomonas subterranea]